MSSPHGQAVRSSWEPVTVCHTTSIWFTHASPWYCHRRRQRGILCGGDPPRGLSDETTSLGTMATATERKKANSSHLDDFCSANHFRRAAKVWSNRENCKDLTTLQAIQQYLPKALDFIVVSFFRWPCYQIQADTPVDVWSNHACQVALFFPSISTACSGRSVRSSPASGNAPLGNQGIREPTGGVLSKASQAGHPGGLAVTGLGKECTLTPSIRSESERELLDLHFHRRPLPEFQDTAEG